MCRCLIQPSTFVLGIRSLDIKREVWSLILRHMSNSWLQTFCRSLNSHDRWFIHSGRRIRSSRSLRSSCNSLVLGLLPLLILNRFTRYYCWFGVYVGAVHFIKIHIYCKTVRIKLNSSSITWRKIAKPNLTYLFKTYGHLFWVFGPLYHQLQTFFINHSWTGQEKHRYLKKLHISFLFFFFRP